MSFAGLESARHRGCVDVGADLLQRPLDRGSLDHRRGRAPNLVGDPRAGARRVVVLDRAATGNALHRLDEAKRNQAPDVIADHAERSVEFRRELAGTGDALLQCREDPRPQWMRERLRERDPSDVPILVQRSIAKQRLQALVRPV